MIAYVKGVLAEKDLTRAVVEANGIGYELQIPMSTYDRLPRENEPVTLKTYLHVRDDGMLLFGFHADEERSLFTLLIGAVSGIGPKLALNILSCMSVDNFCRAIAEQDTKALSRISGIGKRSAERLVVELRDKVAEIAPAAALGAAPPVAEAMSRQSEDAVSGLISLGFKPDAARKAVHTLRQESPDKEMSAQDIIRQALSKFNN